ncbi:SMC5-SMC6 complex localization factor protein 2 [Betta splendens]|uniref:SMC5-SMC6 complex localization factor protein 2 n=1 Tax=Betta splendens TaxID=158456 RepID=A0A6P7PYV2_BETSP|nr:SMC5-SMC6 complex localization factor protein 2 [Betta splendens]
MDHSANTMKTATKNEGTTRTFTENLSSHAKSKGKDHVIQPNFSSYHQETPMKSSHIQNRLSHPPNRRILSVQSPELSHRDMPGTNFRPSNALGTSHSPGFVHSRATSASRPHPARDRLGPLQCFVQPHAVTISRTKMDTLAHRSQYSPSHMPHPASSQYMRDLSNHSPSSHIRRDQAPEPKVTHSGSKTVTAKSQEFNKAQSSEAKHSISTVQLQRLPVTPSSGSSSLTIQSRVATSQEQHKSTSSNSTPIPVVDVSSRKNQRDCKHSDTIAKKLCVQGVSSWKTPKSANRISLNSSQVLSLSHSSDMKQSPRTTEPFNQSACMELSSTPKACIKRPTPMGVKQAFVNFCQNDIVKLRSPVISLDKIVEVNTKATSGKLSDNISHKDTSNLPDGLLGSTQTGHSYRNTSVVSLKSVGRDKQDRDRRNANSYTSRPSSKTNSGSRHHLASKRNKTAHSRKRSVVPNDVDELFTPDPMTYVVSPTHKMAKPKLNSETVKLPVPDKCSSGTAISSSNRVNAAPCRKTLNSTVTSPPCAVDQKVILPEHKSKILSPFVSLVRLKPAPTYGERLCFKDGSLKNGPVTPLGKPLAKGVKTENKVTSPPRNDMSSNISEMDTGASKQTPASTGSQDPMDVELGLSFALDLDLTQSSHSTEEEQLLSLQEIMECVTKPPDTPEKGAFSEPSTPGHHRPQLKSPLPSTTNSAIYKNSLDQMLMEINITEKAKEIEKPFLSACKENVLRIAEYEEAQEKQDDISTEQQEFLQRYSVMSSGIRDVPPGEVAFNLEKFGQIFNQDTLQLRQCVVNPQGAAQKTLLWSSPAQLRLHVTIGLFQEAYNNSICPAQVTRFLFKMMSVSSERLVSEMMLQALCDIACSAAYHRVKNGNQDFKVWVPSLADVTLVLMNMGVAFVTLFPFDDLQPSFTEGDLLENEHVTIETTSSNKDLSIFPEHNCNNMLKYLFYCLDLCPRAYSDDELLLLLTVVGRIGLDPRLILKSSVVKYQLVDNIRNWDNMLPRICQAYTDLTDDHHNMCQLVQMLPDSTRGWQLRQHVSLSMISKLLDGNCTYRPTEKELQLSKLRPYLPRMKPSTIRRALLTAPSKSQKDEEDMATLDQQAYYLCYSLLTLVNEASNFPCFPAQQKEQLLFLCSELETHVKCDIRESEKCLYRCKVKDLVTRIYIKWQMLLRKTRPLHGKLYDYWQPPPTNTLSCSQEEQTTGNSDYEEGTEMDEDTAMEEGEQEKNTIVSEENESLMIEEQKEEKQLNGEEDMKVDEKLKTEGEISGDQNQTEGRVNPVPVELRQEMSALEVEKDCKAVDEHKDGGSTASTEEEAKTIDETYATTYYLINSLLNLHNSNK